MAAGERRMPRWTKRRSQARRKPRRPCAAELLLVIHVYKIADGEAAVDQLDRPGLALIVQTQQLDHISGQAVRLYVALVQISRAIFLHERKELFELDLDELLGRLKWSAAGRLPSVAPTEFVGIQPTSRHQIIELPGPPFKGKLTRSSDRR